MWTRRKPWHKAISVHPRIANFAFFQNYFTFVTWPWPWGLCSCWSPPHEPNTRGALQRSILHNPGSIDAQVAYLTWPWPDLRPPNWNRKSFFNPRRAGELKPPQVFSEYCNRWSLVMSPRSFQVMEGHQQFFSGITFDRDQLERWKHHISRGRRYGSTDMQHDLFGSDHDLDLR